MRDHDDEIASVFAAIARAEIQKHIWDPRLADVLAWAIADAIREFLIKGKQNERETS